MNKYIKSLAAAALLLSMTSCGDKFLETDIYNGIDLETGLTNVTNIGYALNGTYYRLHQYYFAGNYATSFGDIGSDLSYWNKKSSHFTDIYQFTPNPETTYLKDIWSYGYKVIDNSSRIIKAGDALLPTLSDDEAAELTLYIAEAHALRAYAGLSLVNIFGHQVKVNGQDFSAKPGIVVVTSPVEAFQNVKRSTVGESYTAIINDFKKALSLFDQVGGDRGDLFYMNATAVHGLLARTYLYLEQYDDAASQAWQALHLAGISSLADTPESYKALYGGGASNTESFFALDINTINNWSANSCGTLWTTYSYSPSPWLQSIMADDDCRRAVWGWSSDSTPSTPIFNGGKFGAFAIGGNTASATNYLVNAPEMFLIEAEAYANLSKTTEAQAALFQVAKRNPAIASVSDLPADAAGIKSFIHDERARELFQEGLRLYDLRRWDVKANLYATGAPAISWLIKDFKISDCVYPIPSAEVNAGFGVQQNEGWSSTFPKM